jgi:hypothetical protein
MAVRPVPVCARPISRLRRDKFRFTYLSARVRNGVGLDGRSLDPNRMPWPTYRHLSDLEMAVIFEDARASLP